MKFSVTKCSKVKVSVMGFQAVANLEHFPITGAKTSNRCLQQVK